MIGCGVYYYSWIWVVPKLRGYRIRQEAIRLDDGAQSHRLVKVPVPELVEWDTTHDAVGRLLTENHRNSSQDSSGKAERVGQTIDQEKAANEGTY